MRHADHGFMQVGQFPASAANSLIEGYCDDFVSLAAILAQTLEQISIRGISIDRSKPALSRIENGMRNLAEAIHELLERGKVTTELGPVINKDPTLAAPAPRTAAAPTPPNTSPQPVAPTPAAGQAPAKAPTPKPPAKISVPPLATPTPAPAPAQPSAPARTTSSPTADPSTTRIAARSNGNEGLRGNAQSMPLLSVFQFLGRKDKQGTMIVRTQGEQLAFDLVNGSITATSTDRCPREERIGELLVERGHCSREQAEEVARRVQSGGFDRFGEVAIELGYATRDQIADAFQMQVRRRFGRACKSPDATYEFLEGATQAAAGIFRFAPVAIA